MKYYFLFILFILAVTANADDPGLLIKMNESTSSMGMSTGEHEITTYLTTKSRRDMTRTIDQGVMAMYQEDIPFRDGTTIIRLDEDIEYNLKPGINSFIARRVTSLTDIGKGDTISHNYEDFKTTEQKAAEEKIRSIGWISTIDTLEETEIINSCECIIVEYSSVPDSVNLLNQMIRSRFWLCNSQPGREILREYNKRYIEMSGILNLNIQSDNGSYFTPMLDQYNYSLQIQSTSGLLPYKMTYEIMIPNTINQDSLPTSDKIKAGIDSLELDDSSLYDSLNSNIGSMLDYYSEITDDYMSIMTIIYEVTELQEIQIPDSLFEIPSEYKKVDSFE